MRVLLVEDERPLAKAICEILLRNNYSVDLAYDGEEGLWQALRGVHDLLILDIMLPKKDGLSLLSDLRKKGISAPVLMLSALGQSRDKVRGLDGGADDYLSKPFYSSELLARLQALLRRQPELNHDGLICFGGLSLDPHSLTLHYGKNSVALSLKESQLLELLVRNQNRAISRTRISDKLWGYEGSLMRNTDNRVETHVSLLRRKIKDLGTTASITTVRGLGYILLDTANQKAPINRNPPRT
jgi:DNA-binding response OmpR family regulator